MNHRLLIGGGLRNAARHFQHNGNTRRTAVRTVVQTRCLLHSERNRGKSSSQANHHQQNGSDDKRNACGMQEKYRPDQQEYWQNDHADARCFCKHGHGSQERRIKLGANGATIGACHQNNFAAAALPFLSRRGHIASNNILADTLIKEFRKNRFAQLFRHEEHGANKGNNHGGQRNDRHKQRNERKNHRQCGAEQTRFLVRH